MLVGGLFGQRALLSTTRVLALSMSTRAPSIVLDPFCFRQFDDEAYSGSKVPMAKDEFARRVDDAFASGAAPLVDGYAPFCKHLFLENFCGVRGSVLKITPDNEPVSYTHLTLPTILLV